MADPRLKQIKIKTGIVKRLTKEKVSYEKEAAEQKKKVEDLKASGGEEYYVRKQEEVLQECLMMVPDCQRRLLKAVDDLTKILASEKDLAETQEVVEAAKFLEEAQVQLPA